MPKPYAPGWLLLLLGACGGGRDQAPPATPASEPAKPSPGLLSTPASKLDGATVYDASGQAKSCEPPRADCPAARSDAKFRDSCRSAGYQIRRCGCENVCSGKVDMHPAHYDARGQAQECAPAKSGCEPPDTPAAFQDACNDAKHHLVVCGCAWLCDGPPKR
jgi:hypothetical protein